MKSTNHLPNTFKVTDAAGNLYGTTSFGADSSSDISGQGCGIGPRSLRAISSLSLRASLKTITTAPIQADNASPTRKDICMTLPFSGGRSQRQYPKRLRNHI
jgi:hypothetical protein